MKNFFKDTKRLIIAACSLLVFSICCVIEPMITILCICVIAFVFYAYYNNKKNMPSIEQQEYQRIMTTYECIRRVIEKTADLIGVKTPYSIEDIVAEPQVIIKEGYKFVRCSVLKSSIGLADNDTLHNYMKILQGTIDRFIKSGSFVGIIPYPTFDGRLPLFVIDDVKDNGTYLEIEVAIADNKAMCDYLWGKKYRKAPEISAERTDGEF